MVVESGGPQPDDVDAAPMGGVSALIGELVDDPVVQTVVVVLLAVLAVLVYRWWARRYPDEDF
jgi:hypothetical protein